MSQNDKYSQSLKDDFEDPIPKDTDLRDKFYKTRDMLSDHFKEMKDEERNQSFSTTSKLNQRMKIINEAIGSFNESLKKQKLGL